jgi:hypothetical protein
VAETRGDALRLAREEKQKSATPYQPNGLERGMKLAEDKLATLLEAPDGPYMKLGSLATGSGFAFGGGLRNRRLFDREGDATIWGAYSLKTYWAVEARLDFPDLANGHLTVNTYGRVLDYPRQDFFGIGPEARRDDHTSFNFENRFVGGRVGVKPARGVTVGGGLEYSRPRATPGEGRTVPTVLTRFAEDTVPGLGAAPDFFRTIAFAEVDYRQPKNARRGGWYRLEWSNYDEPTDLYTFQKFDVDLRQFVSVLAERRVFAFRLAASTSDTAAGARMPFYLMPTLGGHDSLRGFRDYRFRGPHAILGQAEYRFEIWSAFDAALFYDTGKVAMRRADLNFKDLEDAYGFGFRFNTDNGVVLRIDAGFGSNDGKHLYIVFGDVF